MFSMIIFFVLLLCWNANGTERDLVVEYVRHDSQRGASLPLSGF
jgi:hypothetical protein